MSSRKNRDHSVRTIVGHQRSSKLSLKRSLCSLRYAWAALFLVIALPGCAALSEPPVVPNIVAVEKIAGGTDRFIIRGANFSEVDHSIVVKDAGHVVTLYQHGKISPVSPEKLWTKRGSPWAKPLERTSGAGFEDPHYQGKGKSYNGYLKVLENSGTDRLFVSWRLKLSESPGHSKGSNKFIRIWDKTNGKGTRISWTQMHLTYPGSEKPSWGGWPGKGGQWNQMSLWVDSNKGVIQAWVNEKLAHDVSDFRKRENEKGLNIKLIGFDPSRGTPYKDMKVEIDDLYVASTQARVVVSDKPDWTEAKSRQSAQVPTAWRDDQIRFVYHPADYLGEKHYLYVVNKHGDANTKGFPISGASMPAPEDQPE